MTDGPRRARRPVQMALRRALRRVPDRMAYGAAYALVAGLGVFLPHLLHGLFQRF